MILTEEREWEWKRSKTKWSEPLSLFTLTLFWWSHLDYQCVILIILKKHKPFILKTFSKFVFGFIEYNMDICLPFCLPLITLTSKKSFLKELKKVIFCLKIFKTIPIIKKRKNSLEPALGKTKGNHVAIRNGWLKCGREPSASWSEGGSQKWTGTGQLATYAVCTRAWEAKTAFMHTLDEPLVIPLFLCFLKLWWEGRRQLYLIF